MEKEDLKKLLNDIAVEHREQIKTEVRQAVAAASVDDNLKTSAIKEMNTRLEALGLKEDVLKNLTEAIEKQGEAMRKMVSNTDQKEETLEKFIEKKADEIRKLSTISRGAPGLKLEIPAHVLKTQVSRAGVSGTTMAMRLLEVGQLAYKGLRMSQLFQHFPVDPSSNGYIRFYDQNSLTRASAPTNEGNNAPESAITWIERTLQVQKIMDSIPVTKEAWKDVYFIQQEVDRLLNINLAIKEDQQLWAGTGVSPQLAGLFPSAQVFDATSDSNFAYQYSPAGGGVGAYNANIFDLISTVRVAIMNATNADGSQGKQSKYQPDTVVMNPADILTYRLTKDSFGRYLFDTEDLAKIAGMNLVESSTVTAGTLVVGDFRYGRIFDLDPVTVEMGYVNAQFVQDAMTILAEKREALLVRNADADGFASVSSISTQINAINQTSK